jgi:hypothetical protein
MALARAAHRGEGGATLGHVVSSSLSLCVFQRQGQCHIVILHRDHVFSWVFVGPTTAHWIPAMTGRVTAKFAGVNKVFAHEAMQGPRAQIGAQRLRGRFAVHVAQLTRIHHLHGGGEKAHLMSTAHQGHGPLSLRISCNNAQRIQGLIVVMVGGSLEPPDSGSDIVMAVDKNHTGAKS